MPIKNRHFVVSLGNDLTGASAEVDLSSANWAYIYGTSVGVGDTTWELQASPEPFGTSATWYRYGTAVTIETGKSFVVQAPPSTYNDYCTPRRVRVEVTSGELDGVYIEGIREIA